MTFWWEQEVESLRKKEPQILRLGGAHDLKSFTGSVKGVPTP